jgi:hypothetical protein
MVSFTILRTAPLQWDGRLGKMELESAGRGADDVILHGSKVRAVPLIIVRPQMRSVATLTNWKAKELSAATARSATMNTACLAPRTATGMAGRPKNMNPRRAARTQPYARSRPL